MELAEKLGSFPGFHESRYASGQLQVQLASKSQAIQPELHYDWDQVASEVRRRGLRNSLLVAIAPTATIASIVGSYESIEPQVSNFFKRETLSGEFLQVNRYLIQDLIRLGLWSTEMRARIITADGSIQHIEEIPEAIRALYKTVWEIPQKELIDMAVERSAFICQSQSLNLFIEEPTIGKISSMYMYAWKQGVKTTYYLRSRARTRIQKTTVDREQLSNGAGAVSAGPATPVAAPKAQGAKQYSQDEVIACSLENPEACEACQ
jgi:ribonucleoside-diphosphate reductase alpha chain